MDIINHLNSCKDDFVPQLDSYVDIESYAEKLYLKAIRHEVWDNGVLIGLVAGYLNLDGLYAHISNVSVSKGSRGKGFGEKLLISFINECVDNKIKNVDIEVAVDNKNALKFYEKLSFVTFSETNGRLKMRKEL